MPGDDRTDGGAVVMARTQVLSDAAYAATLYLEELEGPESGLKEADVAGDGDQNVIFGDTKIQALGRFLKLQEDAFRAFKPGTGMDSRGGSPHAGAAPLSPTPSLLGDKGHMETYQLAPQSSWGGISSSSREPGPNISHSPVPGQSLGTSTNHVAPCELPTIAEDLSSPEAAIEMGAAARRTGQAVNEMGDQLHWMEQQIEKYHAQASSGGKPLAPQLSLLSAVGSSIS